MSGFLYYIPGGTTGTKPADVGLEYALDPTTPVSHRGCKLPGHGEGVLVADDRHVSLERFRWVDGTAQKWRNVPGTECRAGFWLDDPPAPADLARAHPWTGHPVTLGDGREWIVPVIRGFREDDAGGISLFDAVDRRVDWDDAGRRIVGDVVPAHAELFDLARRWFDLKTSAEVDGDWVRLCGDLVLSDAALALLAGNYRIGRAEAGLLGLLTERIETDILDAAIDWPSWVRWLKKKQATATSPTGDGPLAATATTGRPSPIS